jgi:hypothetical protein
MFQARFAGSLLTKPAHLNQYDLKAHRAKEEQAKFKGLKLQSGTICT